MSGPSFPCQDPSGASGKNEVGEQNARFKGRRCLRIDHSLLGRPLISPKRAAWLLHFDRLLGSTSISLSVARGDVIERSGEAVLVDAPFGLLPLGEGRRPSGEFKLDLDQRTIPSCIADQGLKKGAFKQQPPRLPTRAEVMTERHAGKFVPKFTPSAMPDWRETSLEGRPSPPANSSTG
ncbi:hypothetical protein J2Z19_005710 [Ensifer adhaerens]|uniref:Uncharacterized protein n=1 Tax=Ensifer adhaerens TaxID=106592 RepID=A0ACC5T4B7_ENSAD|nr:hypothetical protein [Ensifer adhaerens]